MGIDKRKIHDVRDCKLRELEIAAQQVNSFSGRCMEYRLRLGFSMFSSVQGAHCTLLRVPLKEMSSSSSNQTRQPSTSPRPSATTTSTNAPSPSLPRTTISSWSSTLRSATTYGTR
ncbi:hypothetical protein BU25DRAFT_421128 [Macroventuria anomochaeta]|uniref:Uncharacterized protein n=1 Tax=Macroventuria anomochaeta TaxID=301207 RepID=A0ACB6S1V4_9PLEO|nr:uncharacterized protein BU25DRAFT_421128 [Macroventuria anomochaeta]KAF2628126.1 hypothetical protein BU25DRAFT_421128 [Macroventuria anomochaeta]